MQCAFHARYSGCGFLPAPAKPTPASTLFPGVVVSLSLVRGRGNFHFIVFSEEEGKRQSKKQTLSRFLISLFLSVARPSLPSGSQKKSKRLRAAAMRRYIISDTAAEKEQGVRLGEQVTCFCTRTREVEGVKSEKDASLSVIYRDSQAFPAPGSQGHGWAYDSH